MSLPVSPVQNWAEFDERIRYQDGPLLRELDRFSNPVLVAGCQRSGTTAITAMLKTELESGVPDALDDSELSEALVLAGALDYSSDQRVCFQTTYLNERYEEYYEHSDYTLIWVIRNPVAVVRSMIENWRIPALRRLHRGVGKDHDAEVPPVSGLRGLLPGAAALRMACASYIGKHRQLTELVNRLPAERLVVVDYDQLFSGQVDWVELCQQRLGIDNPKPVSRNFGKRVSFKLRGFHLQDIEAYADAHCGVHYEAGRKLVNV